jgi:hypothetical protein
MYDVLFAKTPIEAKVVTFDFQLVATGALTIPTVEALTLAGSDPDAAGLTLGTPTIAGSSVLCLVEDGVNDCTYVLTCTVTDASNQIHQASGALTTTTSATH